MNGYLIDNDIFFASIYEGHTQHKASRKWLDDVKPSGWAISTETFLAAMRLLMNPAVMGPNPLNGEQAWDVVSMEIGGKHPANKLYATHLPDRELFAPATGHKQIMDLWLVQLSREHGYKLATRDHALVRNNPDYCFLLKNYVS